MSTEDQPPEVDTEAYQFREVMACMHGDGGHYLSQHGPKKAADDALAKYYGLIQQVESAAHQPSEAPDRAAALLLRVLQNCEKSATAVRTTSASREMVAAQFDFLAKIIREGIAPDRAASPTGGAT